MANLHDVRSLVMRLSYYKVPGKLQVKTVENISRNIGLVRLLLGNDPQNWLLDSKITVIKNPAECQFGSETETFQFSL